MSTAVSQSDSTSLGARFAQWRKERRLERQSRNVASRQMRGGALVGGASLKADSFAAMANFYA